jgi:hypothetical protein
MHLRLWKLRSAVSKPFNLRKPLDLRLTRICSQLQKDWACPGQVVRTRSGETYNPERTASAQERTKNLKRAEIAPPSQQKTWL